MSANKTTLWYFKMFYIDFWIFRVTRKNNFRLMLYLTLINVNILMWTDWQSPSKLSSGRLLCSHSFSGQLSTKLSSPWLLCSHSVDNCNPSCHQCDSFAVIIKWTTVIYSMVPNKRRHGIIVDIGKFFEF